jgi:hypothetical protein
MQADQSLLLATWGCRRRRGRDGALGLAAPADGGLLRIRYFTTPEAFYPHFQSKADLVRESVAAALEEQSRQLQELPAAGGPEKAITAYLSSEHRDNPEKGCAFAALLPELARQSPEARSLFAGPWCVRCRRRCRHRPKIRRALRWLSMPPSSARFNSPALWKERHCRIASWQPEQLQRGPWFNHGMNKDSRHEGVHRRSL